MEFLANFKQQLECSQCGALFDKPHSFSTCGHTFCYECVISTLEGPGISKSECPVCSRPGWKNDLRKNHPLASVVETTQKISINADKNQEQKQAAARASRRKHAQSAAPPVGPGSTAAASDAARGSVGAAVRQHASRSRSPSAMRRRWDRSVPDPEAQEGEEEVGRRQVQSAGQPQQEHGQEQEEQQQQQPHTAEGGRGRHASSAGPACSASEQQLARAAAAAAAAGEEAKAVVGARPDGVGTVPAADSVSTRAEPTTPDAVVYDSDWEERMLALPPPAPEELPALEVELELLKQALLLCDQLPCLGGPAAPAAEGGSGSAAAAAAAAADLGAQPSEPAADGCPAVMAPPQHEPWQKEAAAVAQPEAEMQQAAPAEAAANPAALHVEGVQGERVLQVLGPTQELDDETGERRLSGRKRRKRYSGRSVSAASRTASAVTTAAGPGRVGKQEQAQQPAGAAQAAVAGGSGSALQKRVAPGANSSSDDDDAFKQPPARRQQRTVQQRGAERPCKAALRCGEKVEVLWAVGCQAGAQLVPFHGQVVAVNPAEGRHQVEYVDGEVAWHDLDEEQWRLLSYREYQQAVQQYQQRSSSTQGSGGSSSPASTEGSGRVSSGSEGAGHVGAAAPPAEKAPPAAAAAAGADPYLFISNTEVQVDAALPPGRPPGQQHQTHSVQQRPLPARRPLAPPPKFHQAPQQPHKQLPPPPQHQHRELQQQLESSQLHDPEWLQAAAGKPAEQQQLPHSAAAAPAASAAAIQQQFGRKRKLLPGEDGVLPDRLEAPVSTAAAAGGAGHAPLADSQQGEQQEEGHTAAATHHAPSTQDAAGALFEMLAGQQPIPLAAAASGGAIKGRGALPLQPTGRHNTAAPASAAATFVPASQLLVNGQQPAACAAPPAPAAGMPAGPASRRSGKVLQDPGLFASDSEEVGIGAAPVEAAPAAGGPAAASELGDVQQGGHSEQQEQEGEEEAPPALRVQDLFKGASPSQPSLHGSPEASPAEGQAAAGPAPAPASGSGTSLDAPCQPAAGRRCWVIGGSNTEIQGQALRLQALLGGLDLEESVTERTTHVLVTVDDHGRLKHRSMQYLQALAHGCWLVSHAYVGACLDAGAWVPERQYQAWGQNDSRDAPMLARRRRATGAAGLFAGRRIFLVAERGGSGAVHSKLAATQQMVAAEGGTLVRSLAHGEGGGRGGAAATPSPSPEGSTLLVWMIQTKQEALAALKHAQRRYPGRPVHHPNWVFDSLCRGRCLDPAGYVVTEERPLPSALSASGDSGIGRMSQATQG